MRDNAVLAERFRELAALMEIGGESRFRVSALQRVAQVLESMTQDIRDLAQMPKALEGMEGIGASSAERIREWCLTGELSDLNEWRNKVPPGLLEVLALSGTGPVMTRRLWKEAFVTDRATLREALREGRLKGIKGLGDRTTAQLDEALRTAEAAMGRFRISRVLPGAQGLVDRLCEVPGVLRVAITGSLARGRETVGNIDLVAASTDAARLADVLRETLSGTDVEQTRFGPTDQLTLLHAEPDGAPAVDLIIAPPAAFGAACLFRTGPEAFVRTLVERAETMKLSLTPQGLRPVNAPEGERQDHLVDEEMIFRQLDLQSVPPRRRESQDPYSVSADALVSVAAIAADLHTHTTASDGHMTIEESVEEAKRRGLRVLAITDHSRAAVQANGLSAERLRDHAAHIRDIAARTKDLVLLAGSEVDILPDGTLDYDDATLSQLDIVVASPHASLRQDPAIATERLLRAIRHPAVDIIGHPTGRIIQRRAGLPIELSRVIAEAVAHDVALEINANPLRLDLRDVHAAMVMSRGGLIAINTDMHSAAQFDHIEYGVMTAQRGGVTKDRCVNTWPTAKLLEWLRRRR